MYHSQEQELTEYCTRWFSGGPWAVRSIRGGTGDPMPMKTLGFTPTERHGACFQVKLIRQEWRQIRGVFATPCPLVWRDRAGHQEKKDFANIVWLCSMSSPCPVQKGIRVLLLLPPLLSYSLPTSSWGSEHIKLWQELPAEAGSGGPCTKPCEPQWQAHLETN